MENCYIDKLDEVLRRIEEFNQKYQQLRIAVDFDKVIHGYSQGFKDGIPYDPPVPGAKEALQKLAKKGYYIIIHSARFAPFIDVYNIKIDWEQVELVKKYLDKYKIPYSTLAPKPCVNSFYVDDLALRVNPLEEPEFSWENALKQIG